MEAESVSSTHLHSRGGYAPNCTFQVELAPTCQPKLPGAGKQQGEQLQRDARAGLSVKVVDCMKKSAKLQAICDGCARRCST